MMKRKKITDSRTEDSIKCECGHSVLIGTHRDRIICSWCKHYIYKNEETKKKYKRMEFKSKLGGYLK